MYEYIKGKLKNLTPTQAVVENNGIGYLLQISLNTFAALQSKDEVKLYTLYYVRDDVRALYGFITEQERATFELLIQVSGVGPSTARLLISGMTPAQVIEAVETEDEETFKSVKGIGTKTAKRLILDLKDKVDRIEGDIPVSPSISLAETAVKSDMDEARKALIALGFPPNKVGLTLRKIRRNEDTDTVENIIKQALKLMS